ncbi:MAG: PilZ domain-containing protein [Thermodesulfovibrionales bacterium]
MQVGRRYERFPVDNDEINSSMALADHVQVLDISEGGISLKADIRLNIGRQYTLTIETKRNAWTVKGIIVWSSLIENKEDAKGNFVPIYKAGLQFTNVSREAINEIIGSLQYKKQHVNISNDSEYVNFGLEYLDIQEEDQAKLERDIESLC